MGAYVMCFKETTHKQYFTIFFFFLISPGYLTNYNGRLLVESDICVTLFTRNEILMKKLFERRLTFWSFWNLKCIRASVWPHATVTFCCGRVRCIISCFCMRYSFSSFCAHWYLLTNLAKNTFKKTVSFVSLNCSSYVFWLLNYPDFTLLVLNPPERVLYIAVVVYCNNIQLYIKMVKFHFLERIGQTEERRL